MAFYTTFKYQINVRIIIGLFIVCLLGSCASVNNGFLIKRKYNKGYYLNVASHKKASVKENHSMQQQVREEKPEIVTVEQQTQESTNTATEITPIRNSYNAPQKNSVNTFATNKASLQTNFVSPKQKLQASVNKARSGSKYDEIKFGLWVILFILLSFLYAFVIVAKNPGFPFGLALLIGMLGALLTMLTGVLWI